MIVRQVLVPHTKKNINKLEGVHHSVARHTSRNYQQTLGTVTEILWSLELEPLAERRCQIRLCVFYKIVNDFVDVPHNDLLTLIQQRTRGSHSLNMTPYTPILTPSSLPISFVQLDIRIYMLEDETATAPSAPSFRARLQKHKPEGHAPPRSVSRV